MPETAGTSANNNISTEHYETRRRGSLPQPSNTLPGTGPSDDTLIQRCGRPHDQGLEIRVLCPPHANPSNGNARHRQVHPDISTSILDPSDGHEHSTSPPCPAQTGVCLSLDPHLPHRRQSFVLRKAVPRLSLLRSSRLILWTQRMPFLKEKKTTPIHHGQGAQRP